MPKKLLSREWARVFSRELNGYPVAINEDVRGGCFTEIQKERGFERAVINIGDKMKTEIQKIAGLRHEHGHLEVDSFGLDKRPEVHELGAGMWNVVEDTRINLLEARRYRGFRDGSREIFDPEFKKTPTGSLLFGASQDSPSNADEAYILKLADEINHSEGGMRGETRSEEFYERYMKYVRAITRYVGGDKTPPEADARGSDDEEGDGEDGDSPGPSFGDEEDEAEDSGKGSSGKDAASGEKSSEKSGGSGKKDEKESPKGDSGSGKKSKFGPSKLKESENKRLTRDEMTRATTMAESLKEAMKELYSRHEDIAGTPCHVMTLGTVLNRPIEIPVDEAIQTYAEGYLARLKLAGTRSNEGGVRLNARVAARARFTGETKLFQSPSRTDIRNAKFVILQDVSGSMGGGRCIFNEHIKLNFQLAYHLGKAMEQFFRKHGAQVETFRFGGTGLEPGLSLEAGGGSEWVPNDVVLMRDMVAAGKQVIIFTDGEITDTWARTGDGLQALTELFARAERRPVGLQMGPGDSFLARACPDWNKFTVGGSGSLDMAMDNLITTLSRRLVF